MTPAILLTHLERRRCEETHINFIKKTEKEFDWLREKKLKTAVSFMDTVWTCSVESKV